MSKAPRVGVLFGAGETASHNDPRLPVNWPAVDCDALPPERRDIFLRRKRGIDLYLSGSTNAEIVAACGFGRCQIYRLIRERCLQQH